MKSNLIFRRQFLFTENSINMYPGWDHIEIDRYHLYAHPDLKVTKGKDQKKIVLLIGEIFDPIHFERENADIINEILKNVQSKEDLFVQIKKYSGRYALIYFDDNNKLIFNDALGLREIYYSLRTKEIYCASQPNLIINFASPEIGPNDDREFLNYFKDHSINNRWNPYCKWIGDETYYKGVNHLLPNHYLDLIRREVSRYWPNEKIEQLKLEEAISRGCLFLQGSLKAMANRNSIMMAVTAGIDSRTLLAASRDIKEKIYYFINDHDLGQNHPDIEVPKRIFEKIGLQFHVHKVQKEVDEGFKKTFLKNTFFASERLLPTIYNIYYKKHNNKVNIIGIGEIGRTRYGKVGKNLNGYRIAYKLGHKKSVYAKNQGEKILAELLPISRDYGINLFTLLYWEHTLGNWGATGNSESDIAIEELNPFDSHALYEIFLGVDNKYSKYNNPIIFKEMIKKMWPDVLDIPINPPYTMRGKVEKVIKRIKIYNIAKEIKYQINYYRYGNGSN